MGVMLEFHLGEASEAVGQVKPCSPSPALFPVLPPGAVSQHLHACLSLRPVTWHRQPAVRALLSGPTPTAPAFTDIIHIFYYFLVQS